MTLETRFPLVASEQAQRRCRPGDDGWAVRWTRLSDQGSHRAAGDFDEDGLPDVGVVLPPVDGSTARVDLMRGNGNTATLAQTLGTFDVEVTSIGQGDAGGDAYLDLLVRVAGGGFYLTRNAAQRLWHNYRAQKAIVGGLSGITRIASGNGNNDGIDDLYTLRPGPSQVDRFLGDGSSFQGPVIKNLSGAASYSEFWLEQDFFTVRVVHPDGPTGKSFSRTYGASNTFHNSSDLFSNSFE